jgi:hypothetical protein
MMASDAANQVRSLEIIEDDAARPVLPGEHARQQKNQKERGMEARRDNTRENAEQAQRPSNQNQFMGCVRGR